MNILGLKREEIFKKICCRHIEYKIIGFQELNSQVTKRILEIGYFKRYTGEGLSQCFLELSYLRRYIC